MKKYIFVGDHLLPLLNRLNGQKIIEPSPRHEKVEKLKAILLIIYT